MLDSPPRSYTRGDLSSPPSAQASRGHAGGKGRATGKGPGLGQYTYSSSAKAGPSSSGKSGHPMVGGKGILTGARRHRKISRDTIYGISKGDIRRLARRGGVKRISGGIYEEIRGAMKARLELILRDVVTCTEYCKRKTVTVHDVLFALRRLGKPIYGFDPDTYTAPEKKKATLGRK